MDEILEVAKELMRDIKELKQENKNHNEINLRVVKENRNLKKTDKFFRKQNGRNGQT